MVNERLIEYFKVGIAKGFSYEQLHQALTKQNFSDDEIKDAYDELVDQGTKRPELSPEPTEKPSEISEAPELKPSRNWKRILLISIISIMIALAIGGVIYYFVFMGKTTATTAALPQTSTSNQENPQVQCTMDSECESGLSCINNECMAAPPEQQQQLQCTSNSDCVFGLVCVNNECVAETPQPSGENTAPSLECTKNSDCGTGKRCVNNVCA